MKTPKPKKLPKPKPTYEDIQKLYKDNTAILDKELSSLKDAQKDKETIRSNFSSAELALKFIYSDNQCLYSKWQFSKSDAINLINSIIEKQLSKIKFYKRKSSVLLNKLQKMPLNK